MKNFQRSAALALAFAISVAASASVAAAELPPAVVEMVGKPAEGKGLIVFFRPAKFVGAAVGYKVREGTHVLGKLRNGKYFTADVEPGAHAYTVHSETKDVQNIEVEAGETYFLSGGVSMGVFAGRPNLSPSSVADFEKVMKKLKKAKPVASDDDKDDDKEDAKEDAKADDKE